MKIEEGKFALTEDDFERIASVIGPDVGAAREALRAYFVGGSAKAAAAGLAGVSRSTVTQYVARWEKAIPVLAAVRWSKIKIHKKAEK